MGMTDEEWAAMTGSTKPTKKKKKKPAAKRGGGDKVLGSVSAEAAKNMRDAETIRGKVAARKKYLDSL